MKRPVALELELHVASVVQEDADGPSHDAERHDHLKEPDRARAAAGSNADHRAEHNHEERERDPLGNRVEVLEQCQLDEESDGAEQDQREQNLAQWTVVIRNTHGDQSTTDRPEFVHVVLRVSPARLGLRG